MSPRRNQIAAQHAALFIKPYSMAAKRKNPRSLHTSDASADDDNIFSVICLFELSAALVSDLRVYCAADSASAKISPDTALITADAGADFFSFSVCHFIAVIRIGNSLPAYDNRVDFSVCNRFFVHIRICHSSTAENRNRYGFFQLFRHLKHKALGDVRRRHRIVEGIQGPGIHGQAVIAIGFQQLSNFNRLFQGPADLIRAIEGSSVEALHIALQGKPHGYRKILSAFSLDCLNDILRHTDAVSKASAIFILPVIHEREGKGIQEMSPVHGVNIHTGKACVLAQLRGSAHFLHLGMDLFHGQSLCHDVGIAKCRKRRRGFQPAVSSHIHGKLDEHFAAVCSDSLIQCLSLPDELVWMVQNTVTPVNNAVPIGAAREQQPESALCAAYKIVDPCLCESAPFGIAKPSVHRGHHHTVLYFYGADSERTR